MTGRFAVTLALALALGRPALAEQSRAQQAQPHVDAGQRAFNEENYEVAIREFGAARELYEDPLLTYNIALSYERLDNLPEAIEEYNRYLREAPDARNAEQVRERVETLHRRRVEERDAGLEVEAADDAERQARRDERAERRSYLIDAHHELNLVGGTALRMSSLSGTHAASLSVDFDYMYRFNATWAVGASFLFDMFGLQVSGDPTAWKHYGVSANGRWAHQFLDGRVEIRAMVGLGYQYIDQFSSNHANWVFFRAAATGAWDITHGFGLSLSVGFRLGVAWGGELTDADFGSTFDALAGVFWAF
jgi:tetratricopeptide (TPR) repeat protein